MRGFRFAGARVISANLYGFECFLVLEVLRPGQIICSPALCGRGCSSTILLGFVDFAGRMKRPVEGLIETATIGVGLRGETAYSFPCFLGSLRPQRWRAFLAGVRTQRRMAVSSAAGPSAGL